MWCLFCIEAANYIFWLKPVFGVFLQKELDDKGMAVGIPTQAYFIFLSPKMEQEELNLKWDTFRRGWKPPPFGLQMSIYAVFSYEKSVFFQLKNACERVSVL